jgi:hypothetical protein
MAGPNPMKVPLFWVNRQVKQHEKIHPFLAKPIR